MILGCIMYIREWFGGFRAFAFQFRGVCSAHTTLNICWTSHTGLFVAAVKEEGAWTRSSNRVAATDKEGRTLDSFMRASACFSAAAV